MPSPPLNNIVTEHAEELIFLRNVRTDIVRASNIHLEQLAIEDDRLAAHLDGLAVAGEHGVQAAALAALENPERGELFAATVLALEMRDMQALGKLLALAEAAAPVEAIQTSDAWRGVISAFGWVASSTLQGTVLQLLESAQPFHQRVGLAACGLHGVAPPAGVMAQALAAASDLAVRTQALRVVWQSGLLQYLPDCLNALNAWDAAKEAATTPTSVPEPTQSCYFEASRAAVLLGDRHAAVKALRQLASSANPYRAPALLLVVKLLSFEDAKNVLKSVLNNTAYTPLVNQRLLLQGMGHAGDASYLDWLLAQMVDAETPTTPHEQYWVSILFA
jgi:uncharacterized protein (TIGR02270 family)